MSCTGRDAPPPSTTHCTHLDTHTHTLVLHVVQPVCSSSGCCAWFGGVSTKHPANPLRAQIPRGAGLFRLQNRESKTPPSESQPCDVPCQGMQRVGPRSMPACTAVVSQSSLGCGRGGVRHPMWPVKVVARGPNRIVPFGEGQSHCLAPRTRLRGGTAPLLGGVPVRNSVPEASRRGAARSCTRNAQRGYCLIWGGVGGGGWGQLDCTPVNEGAPCAALTINIFPAVDRSKRCSASRMCTSKLLSPGPSNTTRTNE